MLLLFSLDVAERPLSRAGLLDSAFILVDERGTGIGCAVVGLNLPVREQLPSYLFSPVKKTETGPDPQPIQTIWFPGSGASRLIVHWQPEDVLAVTGNAKPIQAKTMCNPFRAAKFLAPLTRTVVQYGCRTLR